MIKIEPPGSGDQTRGSMGFKMKGADSMGFLNMNRNKRSVALNLKSQAGRAVLLRLVEDADILIENYRPGAMKRLGLGYEDLKDINPRLVYTSISGFGQTGPWADRPGFDLMAQAMSGVMSVTGYPGGPPVKAGVPVADIGCALFAVYATLAAYIGAKTSGQGQHIDAALFDAALAFSVWDICDYWGTGKPPQPLGTANKMTAPYQAMACSDGYFVMGANNQKLWEKLCTLMERPELLDDPRFSTISLRLANRRRAGAGAGAHVPPAAEGLLGRDAVGGRHSGRADPHVSGGVRRRARTRARDAHGDRSSGGGQGPQHRLSGQALRHAAAGPPSSAAAGRAHQRGAGAKSASAPMSSAQLQAAGSICAMNEVGNEGSVRLIIEENIASVVFDRPAARNAMTWTMYEQLGEICELLAPGQCGARRAAYAAPAARRS